MMEDSLKGRLATILASKRLPIQGWVFSTTYARVEEQKPKWPIYAEQPKTDEHGAIVGDPEILFKLPTDELKIRAEFKFDAQPILFSNSVTPLVPLLPEMIEHQVATFTDIHGRMKIVFDPKPIRMYEQTTFVPNAREFQMRVERQVARKLLDPNNAQIRFVLAQLAAIGDNHRNALARTLQTLTNVVRQEEPDYWLMIDQLMSGKIDPKEALKKAKGAFEITIGVPDLPTPTIQ